MVKELVPTIFEIPNEKVVQDGCAESFTKSLHREKNKGS